ncbi:hypothetical protein [Actinokineospora bangkokensis]|uniref:Uncharacterized protein n=1 Tax=Actinokineospora bangkokensis TaxID=1193682 RepID=A0A1Q9LIH0_9PSEU|nr:hypothetical protein [Actinokineospora bangkokensis]OLR91847.1 hypothetical protein BJP25_23705 [Actinokineospora bangkokensis]
MDLRDLSDLMEILGDQGVATLLQFNQERLADNGKPWTVILTGPAVGPIRIIDYDGDTLPECLNVVLNKLREQPGDWSWLPIDFS